MVMAAILAERGIGDEEVEEESESSSGSTYPGSLLIAMETGLWEELRGGVERICGRVSSTARPLARRLQSQKEDRDAHK